MVWVYGRLRGMVHVRGMIDPFMFFRFLHLSEGVREIVVEGPSMTRLAPSLREVWEMGHNGDFMPDAEKMFPGR